MDSRQEDEGNMTTEIVPGGPNREEAKELNRPKPRSKSRVRERLANVAAAGTAAFLGTTLAEQIHQAVNNPPPSRVTEAKPDPTRDNPPKGIRLNALFDSFDYAQDKSAQGGHVEPVLQRRVFIPNVSKEYRELWPAEFGAPERGVVLFNKGVEKGVKIEDQELFENLMYFREKYGRPDLKLKIYFYDSIAQLNIQSGTDPYDREHLGLSLYDFWATSQVPIFDEQGNYVESRTYPPTFKIYGFRRFKLGDDGSLEFHISLPELREGGSNPTPEQIGALSLRLTQNDLWHIFMSHEAGRVSTDKPMDQTDVKNHRVTKGPHSALSIIIK